LKISNVTPTRIISSKIVVDQPSIFLVLCDSNIKIWDYIYKTNFILSNCEAIISPSKIINFMRKSFNGKLHNLEFKKQIIKLDQTSKKLKILNSIHIKDDINSNSNPYYFYDMSIYSNAIGDMIGSNISLQKLTTELFFESGKIWQSIKDNYPNYNVDMLFLMANNQGFLYQMFTNIRKFMPVDNLNEFQFFDNFSYVSTNNKYLIPVIERTDGKNQYIMKNISNIDAYLVEDKIESKEQIIEPEPEVAKEPVVAAKTAGEVIKDKLGVVKGLTGDLKINTNIDEDGEIKIEVNTKQLKKILSNYEIDDPNILSNVKVAIDKYLTVHQESKEKMTREEAEILVLKAINKTIHGTDELREEYVNNPMLLFNKLKNTKNYQVPLNFPKYENELLQPKDIVDLNYTCGQYRQKFEFSDTVHQNVEKLFKTLESTSDFPVKVKNVTHEVIDTDSDRLIQYTITLQNLNGGESKPYNIKLNIPGLVSERYFKLKNSHYIMENQQFMKPITKTNPNDVRLLSNYAIIQVKLVNFKFNAASISDIINYIKIKYPKFIKEETEDEITIFNGDKLGINGNLVFASADGQQKIEIDPDTNRLVDLALRSSLKITKYEYQLEYLFNKLKSQNPNETLSKSKLKVPYLEVYLGGFKLPLILYLWSQKGLLNTLNDESIKYNITDNKPDSESKFTITTNKNQFLNIYPNNFRQTCLVNGLISLSSILENKNINDLNKPESSYEIITQYTESNGAIRMVSLMTENEIDPITKDLLEFEGYSTNIVKIVGKDMVDVLFQKEPDNLADLSIYRARLSEVIFHLLYKQIKAAHNHYRNKVFAYEDKEAKVEIFEDFVTQGLVTRSGILQNTEPFNPVDEIALASRVVKSGKDIGGEMYATIHSDVY